MNCFIGLFYEAFFNVNYGNVAQVKKIFFEKNSFSLRGFGLVTHVIGDY